MVKVYFRVSVRACIQSSPYTLVFVPCLSLRFYLVIGLPIVGEVS
jgi:hypothetical protein